MARKPSKSFTDKELEIMRVIWKLGEASARQIQEQLPGVPPRRRVLSHLIQHVFDGSAASLVLNLVEAGDLSTEDLDEIRRQTAAKREEGRTSWTR